MARKQQSNVQDNGPTLTSDQAAQLLLTQLDKGKKLLKNRPITEAANLAWETVTHNVLIRAFGSSSPSVDSVMKVGRYMISFTGENEQDWERQRADTMTTRLEIIDGLIELLYSNPQLEKSRSSSIPTVTNDIAKSNCVFLVHGHDEAAIHETARFLEGFGLQVKILREQANSGRTIIEKFVDYSDVAFSVILLTGDDRGGPSDQTYENQKPRARQNVILEFGFFLGKLGRERVCALCQEGVEFPSDYSGVLFIPLDKNGAWHLTLARELKAAGLEIDMNKAV